MKRNENASQEPKQKKQGQEKRPKQKKDRELAMITYLFTGLFAALIGYFVYFNVALRPEVVNNPYNSRQENFAKRVVRGELLASDGSVLAKTEVAEDGTETRSYPYGNVFAHVVGYSTRGQTGLESLVNFDLLTSNAFLGEQIVKEIREEKNIGDNVITTLDPELQQTAYNALGNHRGAVVVLEVETGNILAMVSKPDFDPNRVSADWEILSEEGNSDGVFYNRAIQGQYPPGSTFKLVTLLEYMRENPGYEDFQFHCTGSLTEGNYTIRCYGKTAHGDEDLRKAFAKSCNAAFSSIGLSLDENTFKTNCESLLFNSELPLELPYSKSAFSLKAGSTPAERMMTAIGQGETLVSPMHMAMIVSAVANDGVLMEPKLLDRVEAYTGDLVKTYRPKAYGSLMTPEEAGVLKEYLKAVVTEGTGSKLDNMGFFIAGKTGTAEYSSDKSKSHAWFAGFSDTGNGDIAVCVLVEEAGSGSEYAVPVAKEIFWTWNRERE